MEPLAFWWECKFFMSSVMQFRNNWRFGLRFGKRINVISVYCIGDAFDLCGGEWWEGGLGGKRALPNVVFILERISRTNLSVLVDDCGSPYRRLSNA